MGGEKKRWAERRRGERRAGEGREGERLPIHFSTVVGHRAIAIVHMVVFDEADCLRVEFNCFFVACYESKEKRRKREEKERRGGRMMREDDRRESKEKRYFPFWKEELPELLNASARPLSEFLKASSCTLFSSSSSARVLLSSSSSACFCKGSRVRKVE